MGRLPEDIKEAKRLVGLSEHYRAKGSELEVRLPPTSGTPERWVIVPPLVLRDQLVVDTHNALAHCGRDKLLLALRDYYW